MKLLENTVFETISSYLICNAIDSQLDVRLESYSCKMVSTDKKEWKRSFQNTEKTNSLTDTNGVPAKKPYGGKELHPLSPSEDFLISSGYLSTSPIFSTVQFNNGRQIATASRRLRHVSEPTSGGSASSDNDTSDHDNSLGRSHTILVGAVSKRTLFDIVALLNACYPDYDFSQTKSNRFSLVNYQNCVRNVDGKFLATVSNYGRVRDEIWRAINEEINVSQCVIYSYIPDYNSDPFTEGGCIWSFNYLFYNKSLKRFLFFACRALRSDQLDLSSEQLWGIEE
ncbi:maf1 regulator domain-containing protein [Ditylenchus destructor]|nr:maf1 regulator domain-containing protein [Ditylenchus destructor]